MFAASTDSHESGLAKGSFLPSIIVLSDRAVFGDCVVEYLKHSGFTGATGCLRWDGLTGPGPVHPPDLVLLDLGQEHEDAAEELRKLRERWPSTTAVAIGTPLQLAAQAADADGWIEVTDPGARLSTVAKAATARHDGRVTFKASSTVEKEITIWRGLTRRQRQVLGLLGCGADNYELARSLGVTERAVKLHVSALLSRFGAESRTQLALIAAHAGVRAARTHWGDQGRTSQLGDTRLPFRPS
jgi:DNA-binding NarL/FixJ family response regulator